MVFTMWHHSYYHNDKLHLSQGSLVLVINIGFLVMSRAPQIADFQFDIITADKPKMYNIYIMYKYNNKYLNSSMCVSSMKMRYSENTESQNKTILTFTWVPNSFVRAFCMLVPFFFLFFAPAPQT